MVSSLGQEVNESTGSVDIVRYIRCCDRGRRGREMDDLGKESGSTGSVYDVREGQGDHVRAQFLDSGRSHCHLSSRTGRSSVASAGNTC